MIRKFQEFFEYSKNKDKTLAAVMATASLNNGDTLLLGGGEYHFYPDYASEKFYYISNNDYGLKSIAFLLENKNKITIDGEGAKLIFHGKISPFVIDNSENIIIKNLTVDYYEPMYFEAKIIDSGTDFVEMEYDSSQFHLDILDKKFRFYGENWENICDRVLVNEFDATIKGPAPKAKTYFAYVGDEICTDMYASLYRYLTATKTDDNKIRLEGEFGFKHNVGNLWLCTHNKRENPGIFVTESSDILFDNILLSHTLSMGVICQLSRDITLNKVVAAPNNNRNLSVDADATHFVNCSGYIHLNECSFESMMDDALNIHGIYMPCNQKLSNNEILLKFGHYQQVGVNIFKAGDRVRLVNNDTLLPVAEFTVEDSKFISKKYILLKIKEDLPKEIPDGYVFENISTAPKVHIKNCNSGYNRPRGFLITTAGETLIENCTFHNLSHAISICGDANSWFESGSIGTVILRNNCFDNAAYSGGAVIQISPEIKGFKSAYHSTIIVENNYFRTNGKRFIDAEFCDTIIFKGNTFKNDGNLIPNSDLGEKGFKIQNCNNVDIEYPKNI